MMARLSENSLTSSIKNTKITKDGTLEYTLWGGRWILFCKVCLKPVHANVDHCARHLNASSSRGHITIKKRAGLRRNMVVDLYAQLSRWLKKPGNSLTTERFTLSNLLIRTSLRHIEWKRQRTFGRRAV